MKRLIALVLPFSILVTVMAAPANTNSAPVSATKMAIGQTMVTIEPAAQRIPEECILDIVEDNPDSGNIIIYEWGGVGAKATQASVSPCTFIYPGDGGYYLGIETEKTLTRSRYVAEDQFCFSVARGETVTLSQSFTATLSLSLSGSPYIEGDLGLTASVSGTYQKSTTYTGPAESSPYNSREFRIKLFAEDGNWTQTQTYYNSLTDEVLAVQTETGTYTNPLEFCKYSIDHTVSPE